MYFAILWKNPEISMAELELVQIKEISFPKKGIIIFDTKYWEALSQLWGCIKIGTVVKEKQLQELLADAKIIGIQNEANGKHLKRTIGIKRYKLVDIFHTDKEIKNKGKEVINLENGLYGIVEQYQDIELYEAVDFGKPWRSMRMGMMPAKLAHIMINIWLQWLRSIKAKMHENWCSPLDLWSSTIIYDPFVGSGTTEFLANSLGYECIGSDINIEYATQNIPRRKTTKFYQPEEKITVFTHDITKKLKTILPETKKDIVIVTEGRLWPIVTKSTSAGEVRKFQEQVIQIYKSFLERIQEIWCSVAVCTIPYYAGQTNFLEKEISEYATKIKLEIQGIPEIYGREGQQIGRKIMIIKQENKMSNS